MADIDYRLRNDVAVLVRAVSAVDTKVEHVATGVTQVSIAQHETRSDLQQLRADFLAFIRQAERTASIQRAETRVGVIKDEVEHQFGHHRVVRRSATGLLQAFDTGLVSDDTVQHVSEQLMIQTPRYWLAPALVALAAWSRDNQELCTRAVEEAFRRSPGRTSLLFALVTRRQGRLGASVRWLKHYLDVQDPAKLGRDFAVVLESVSQGAFGPAGKAMVQEVLAEWRATLITDDAVTAAQVDRWKREIEARSTDTASGRFPSLRQLSPEWPRLAACLSGAATHESVLADYGALLREEMRPSDRLEDAVDDILDRLVSEYDDEELPLRRELAFNEAVIASDGDLDAARKQADLATAAMEETLDYLTIQTTSALRPATIGVSRATQRVAVAACSDWFRSAHDAFCRDYRRALPADVTAAFSTSHSAGARTFSLPTWTASFRRPMADLEASLAAHWDGHTAPFLRSLVYDWKKALIVPAIVLVVVMILGFSIDPAFGFFATVVVGGIWGYVIHKRHETAEQAIARARSALESMKQESIVLLRAAGAELQDWSSEFRRLDARAAAVTALIDDFATAGHAASPYEKRVVMSGGTI